MTTKKLESYIGKEVKIILFNGNEIKGTLRKAKVPFTNAYALDGNKGNTRFFKENHVKKIVIEV